MCSCSFYPVLTYEGNIMQAQCIYDYELVDSIRTKEREYQQALERAKQSVQALTASVMRLREQRLTLEINNDD
jgi:hypothetical protein